MILPKEHFGYAFVGIKSGKVLERANLSAFVDDEKIEVKEALKSPKTHTPNVSMLLFNSLYDSVDLTDKIIEFAEKHNLFTNRISEAFDVKLYFASDDDKRCFRGLKDLKNDMATYLVSKRKHYYEIPIITADDLKKTPYYQSIIEITDLYNPFRAIIKMASRLNEIPVDDGFMDVKEASENGLDDIYTVMLDYELLENYKELGLNISQIKDLMVFISYVISENSEMYNPQVISSYSEGYKNYVKAISDTTRPLTEEHKKAVNTYLRELLKLKSEVIKPLHKSGKNSYSELLNNIYAYLEGKLKNMTRYYDDNDDVDLNKLGTHEKVKRVVDRFNRLFRDGSMVIDESNSEYIIMLSKYIQEYNEIVTRELNKGKGHERVR